MSQLLFSSFLIPVKNCRVISVAAWSVKSGAVEPTGTLVMETGMPATLSSYHVVTE